MTTIYKGKKSESFCRERGICVYIPESPPIHIIFYLSNKNLFFPDILINPQLFPFSGMFRYHFSFLQILRARSQGFTRLLISFGSDSRFSGSTPVYQSLSFYIYIHIYIRIYVLCILYTCISMSFFFVFVVLNYSLKSDTYIWREKKQRWWRGGEVMVSGRRSKSVCVLWKRR